WAAMAAVEFSHRPVAGIAGAIDLLSEVKPGQELELSAELDTVDTEAVAYGGTARVNGVPVLQLRHCVGPMLPLPELDDPRAVPARFKVLCGPGAVSGAFGGAPILAFEQIENDANQAMRAIFRVPDSAPLFLDHFAFRPVFPGSLLMHMNIRLAAALAEKAL